MEISALQNKLRESGIVGAGGAGFPAYAKLSKGINTIVLNCAECEPLLSVDKMLIAKHTKEIFDGLSILQEALHAHVIVAVKESYTKAMAACENLLGGYSGFELKSLPDRYPTGDEVSLIYEATGRIVPQGQIPLSVGVVVFNVETIYNIYQSVKFDQNVVDTYLTIAGEVHRTTTVKASIGTSVRELLQFAGGTSISEYVILSGGPMTGQIVTPEAVVSKTTKGILVLHPSNPAVVKKQANISKELNKAMSVCSQCRMCTDLCPRYLLGHSIQPHQFMRIAALGRTEQTDAYKNTLYCCECGICELYACHQGLSPRRLMSQFKSALRANGVKPQPKESQVNPMMAYRHVPEHRLISRLGLAHYPAPTQIEEITHVQKVRILLGQGIGNPATPVVTVGQQVSRGQVIGVFTEEKLGVNLHASITGVVSAITDRAMEIEAGGTNG